MSVNIKIIGKALTSPKIKENGTVDILFREANSRLVAEGLKSLGESTYLVHITRDLWLKIAGKVKNESIFIIEGEPAAKKNKKELPFIEVIAFNVELLIEDEKNIESIDKEAGERKKIESSSEINVEESNPMQKKITKRSKLNDIHRTGKKETVSVKDIFLVETVHTHANFRLDIDGKELSKVIESKSMKKNITIRKMDNGKYALVMGFRSYIYAKIANIETVDAFIVDMKHAELVEHLGIQDLAEKYDITKPQEKKVAGATSVQLTDIKIPEPYRNSSPSPVKIQEMIKYYKENGRFDKLIQLDKDYNLINGYKRYVAAIEMGLDKIVCYIQE